MCLQRTRDAESGRSFPHYNRQMQMYSFPTETQDTSFSFTANTGRARNEFFCSSVRRNVKRLFLCSDFLNPNQDINQVRYVRDTTQHSHPVCKVILFYMTAFTLLLWNLSQELNSAQLGSLRDAKFMADDPNCFYCFCRTSHILTSRANDSWSLVRHNHMEHIPPGTAST